MFHNTNLDLFLTLYRDKVRVRFAPSNTGWMHAGGLRTALYNYLFAKKHNGTFILRIEDTDQTRYVPGSDKYIVDALHWLGIDPDEGFDNGISPGSDNYIQSKRAVKGIYKEYADYLVQNGFAYICFDTPQEIEAMRKIEKENGVQTPSYNYHTREYMKNSLTLHYDEVYALIGAGTPYTIRFKFDNTGKKIVIEDLIRGTVEFATNLQDDKILMKSDGMPTYHLANVVDDLEMGISHVIRGEEWLSSCALHASIYEALGYKDRTPKFVHLPLILKPTGQGKLSKRDGINLGIPIFPFQITDPESGKIGKGYREEGFFPQAVLNHLALIGWHPGEGSEKEMFTIDELIQAFSFDGVNKSGARYDHQKLLSFNQRYLRLMDNETIAKQLIDKNAYVRCHHINYVIPIVGFLKDRATFVNDIYEKGKFFFVDPEEYDIEFIKEAFNQQTKDFLLGLFTGINFTLAHSVIEQVKIQIDEYINYMTTGLRLDKKTAIQLLNVVMTGSKNAPNIASVIAILGVDQARDRITNAIQYFEEAETIKQR